MKDLRLTSRFKKDLKRVSKRGCELAKLETVIDLLRQEQDLPAARKDHALKGAFADCRECHLAPDWLLIYQVSDDEIILIRTGSHADLFE